jgi:integrase
MPANLALIIRQTKVRVLPGPFDWRARFRRSIPSDQVARVLDGLSRRDDNTRPDDLVFSPGYNVPFHHDTVRRRFYVALHAAGLGRLRAKDGPIVFHYLRHTFGTLAVQAFTLSEVKAMVGHVDITTTIIYVHHVRRTAARRWNQCAAGTNARDAATARSASSTLRRALMATAAVAPEPAAVGTRARGSVLLPAA